MRVTEPTPDPQPPIDLDTFARVSAELDVAAAPRAEILARVGVEPAVWERGQLYWSRRLADDAMEDGALTDAYAAALARARDQTGPLPVMTPEEWAQLTLDMGQHGADKALAARGLLPAVYFRLASHWAAVLAKDTAASARYARALYAAVRK